LVVDSYWQYGFMLPMNNQELTTNNFYLFRGLPGTLFLINAEPNDTAMKGKGRVLAAFGFAISAIVLTGLAVRREPVDPCAPAVGEVEAILLLNPGMTWQQAEDVVRYSCKYAVVP
jgi:hypothetical protein